MVDDLFDMFDREGRGNRDGQRQGGIRGFLGRIFGGGDHDEDDADRRRRDRRQDDDDDDDFAGAGSGRRRDRDRDGGLDLFD